MTSPISGAGPGPPTRTANPDRAPVLIGPAGVSGRVRRGWCAGVVDAPPGTRANARHRSKLAMLQRIEMDERVGLADQLAREVGPVILVNTFRVAPADIDRCCRRGPQTPP